MVQIHRGLTSDAIFYGIMKGAPLYAQVCACIVNMIEDIIVTMAVEDFRCRKSCYLFCIVVPEGNFAICVYKVDPFLDTLQISL